MLLVYNLVAQTRVRKCFKNLWKLLPLPTCPENENVPYRSGERDRTLVFKTIALHPLLTKIYPFTPWSLKIVLKEMNLGWPPFYTLSEWISLTKKIFQCFIAQTHVFEFLPTQLSQNLKNPTSRVPWFCHAEKKKHCSYERFKCFFIIHISGWLGGDQKCPSVLLKFR